MKILIVGLVKNEQLNRVRDEAEKRGHTVDGCNSSDLVLDFTNGFSYKLKRNLNIEGYDVIYLWIVGKRKWDWYLVLKDLVNKTETKIVNEKFIDPSYFLLYSPSSDYKKALENNISIPKTVVFFNKKGIEDVLKVLDFPFILKVGLEGAMRKGKGIMLINNEEDLVKTVSENFKNVSRFVAREYIPNKGDIRVFTVGYKAIGAMKRTPKQGDFRSNISQGGTGEEFDLNKRTDVKKIAEKMSEITKTEISGVDVIINKDTDKPYVLEANLGSQFIGLEKYTSTNVALEMVKYFEEVGG